MIKSIIFTFPKDTQQTDDFFAGFSRLLAELQNASMKAHELTFAASEPIEALPKTIFSQASDSTWPQVRIGDIAISSLVQAGSIAAVRTEKHDQLGSYYEHAFPAITVYRLPIEQLTTRLQGHAVRLDHTGYNLPSAQVTKQDWQQLISNLASQLNIYKYPTGEDWPFIVPATAAEYAADITSFPIGREPKFELVYDNYSPVPTIQIDIETDLSRTDVEQLFPAPYGISFPDLADYFRTVYIDHTWLGINIRFDIRFKNDHPGNDWQTAKWLVTEGGRIPGNANAQKS